jgi:hypothetical protein
MTYNEFKEIIYYLEDYHLEHKLSKDDIKLLKFNNCWSEDELPYCSWDNYDRHISQTDYNRIKRLYEKLI